MMADGDGYKKWRLDMGDWRWVMTDDDDYADDIMNGGWWTMDDGQ